MHHNTTYVTKASTKKGPHEMTVEKLLTFLCTGYQYAGSQS